MYTGNIKSKMVYWYNGNGILVTSRVKWLIFFLFLEKVAGNQMWDEPILTVSSQSP
jgi:hypothetical protein